MDLRQPAAALVALLLLPSQSTAAEPAAAIGLPRAWYQIVQPYRYEEARRFEAGWNRGADVLARDGRVRAVHGGVVRFAGDVAGRRVVTVLTRIEGRPVVLTASGLDRIDVRPGDRVRAGGSIGLARMLHVGAYDAMRRSRYLPVGVLPWSGVPPSAQPDGSRSTRRPQAPPSGIGGAVADHLEALILGEAAGSAPEAGNSSGSVRQAVAGTNDAREEPSTERPRPAAARVPLRADPIDDGSQVLRLALRSAGAGLASRTLRRGGAIATMRPPARRGAFLISGEPPPNSPIAPTRRTAQSPGASGPGRAGFAGHPHRFHTVRGHGSGGSTGGDRASGHHAGGGRAVGNHAAGGRAHPSGRTSSAAAHHHCAGPGIAGGATCVSRGETNVAPARRDTLRASWGASASALLAGLLLAVLVRTAVWRRRRTGRLRMAGAASRPAVPHAAAPGSIACSGRRTARALAWVDTPRRRRAPPVELR